MAATLLARCLCDAIVYDTGVISALARVCAVAHVCLPVVGLSVCVFAPPGCS